MSNTESGARRPKPRGADARRARAERARPVVAIPIDSVADAAIAARSANEIPRQHCDVCEQPVAADTLSRGLYVWSRGDERRYEEPPLCEKCATVLGMSALSRWRRQEEEDE